MAFTFKSQGLGGIKVNSAEFENKRETWTNLNLKAPWAPYVLGLTFSNARMRILYLLPLHCGLTAEPIIYSLSLIPVFVTKKNLVPALLNPRTCSNRNANALHLSSRAQMRCVSLNLFKLKRNYNFTHLMEQSHFSYLALTFSLFVFRCGVPWFP